MAISWAGHLELSHPHTLNTQTLLISGFCLTHLLTWMSPATVQSIEDQQKLQRALKAGQILRCGNLYVGVASPADGIL